MAGYNKYDPRLESLVVETRTFWAEDVQDLAEEDRRWLAAAMPLHLFALLVRMVVQSAGRFRMWGAVVVVRSLGLAVTVALVGVGWPRDPGLIAAGVYLPVTRGCYPAWVQLLWLSLCCSPLSRSSVTC